MRHDDAASKLGGFKGSDPLISRLSPGIASMARLALVVFGWPLALLAAVTLYGWIRGPAIPDGAREPSPHHANHERRGQAALEQYAALSPEERALIRESLDRGLSPPADWLRSLDAAGYDVLCLGENHEEATRRYVADRVLSTLAIDVLALEATDADIGAIVAAIDAGEARATMIGVDVAAPLRAARARSPGMVVVGIEETPAQRAARESGSLERGREDSILANLQRARRPGERHLILFGALHCSERAAWLYGRLRMLLAPLAGERLLSVRVLGSRQDGPLSGFMQFLDGIGIAREDFVLADPDTLHLRFREWFPTLASEARAHDAIIAFRQFKGSDLLNAAPR